MEYRLSPEDTAPGALDKMPRASSMLHNFPQKCFKIKYSVELLKPESRIKMAEPLIRQEISKVPFL